MQAAFRLKRFVSVPLVRPVPALAHGGGDMGVCRLSCKGTHRPPQPLQGAVSFLFCKCPQLPRAGLSEVLCPYPLAQPLSPCPAKPFWSQRVKKKKKKLEKAPEHCWAKATSLELPRGQSLSSPGEPRSEHQHSLHIISLAPLPKTEPIQITCYSASETPGLNSVTQSKSWLCQACH